MADEQNSDDPRTKKRGKKPTADYVEPYIYFHDRKEKTYTVIFYMSVVKGSQPVYRQRSGIKGIMEARRVVIEFRNELTKQKERFSNGDKKWKNGREFAYAKIISESAKEDLNRDEYNTRKSLEKHTAVWDQHYMTEITQQMVSDLINTLPDIEAATKNKIRQHISRVYQLNGFKIDPAKQIKIRGYKKTNTRRLAGLSREEVKKLLDHAKEKDPNGFGLLLEFSYLTGCRSGELWALEWDNLIQNEKGEYFFEIKRSYNWYEKRFKSPKNGEIRRVGLSRGLLTTVNKLKLNKPHPKFVLPRIKEWEHGQASKVLRRYLQELKIIPSSEIIKQEIKDGIKNPRNTIRLHDLRGISITHSLAGEKKDLNAVMERVGHKTMATTSLYLKKIEDHQNISVANNLDFNDGHGEVLEMEKERKKRKAKA